MQIWDCIPFKIHYFLFDCSFSEWGNARVLINASVPIMRNNLVTTLETLEKEFKITFEFMATSAGCNGNIIHFTTGGNSRVVGCRIPSVYYAGSNIRVYFAVNGNLNYEQKMPVPMLNQWHSVEILQEKKENDYHYSFSVNGELGHTTINSDARTFQKVQVYASDPWCTAQPGYIRNLKVYSNGEFTSTFVVVVIVI